MVMAKKLPTEGLINESPRNTRLNVANCFPPNLGRIYPEQMLA
jgi:hypothetical protein